MIYMEQARHLHATLSISMLTWIDARLACERTSFSNVPVSFSPGDLFQMSDLGSCCISETIFLKNKDNEKLVGILEGPPDAEVVILCHGFQSSKNSSTIQAIAPGLLDAGFGVFRFDFR